MLGLELVMAGHLLWHASANAPASPIACPAQKSARVDVKWRSQPIRYDYAKNTSHLNNHDVDTVNPYGDNVSTDVGGLMSGKIQYESNIQVSSVRYPVGNVNCLWIDKVTVEIVVDPVIMIAAEHPEGSCKHSAILEHEKKHVATDLAVVKEYLQPARQAVALAVQKVGVVGPKPTAKADEFKKKMTEYIQNALKAEMDKMYADRRERQAAIDTKEEYDRVDAMCPDAADEAKAEQATQPDRDINSIPGMN